MTACVSHPRLSWLYTGLMYGLMCCCVCNLALANTTASVIPQETSFAINIDQPEALSRLYANSAFKQDCEHWLASPDLKRYLPYQLHLRRIKIIEEQLAIDVTVETVLNTWFEGVAFYTPAQPLQRPGEWLVIFQVSIQSPLPKVLDAWFTVLEEEFPEATREVENYAGVDLHTIAYVDFFDRKQRWRWVQRDGLVWLSNCPEWLRAEFTTASDTEHALEQAPRFIEERETLQPNSSPAAWLWRTLPEAEESSQKPFAWYGELHVEQNGLALRYTTPEESKKLPSAPQALGVLSPHAPFILWSRKLDLEQIFPSAQALENTQNYSPLALMILQFQEQTGLLNDRSGMTALGDEVALAGNQIAFKPDGSLNILDMLFAFTVRDEEATREMMNDVALWHLSQQSSNDQISTLTQMTGTLGPITPLDGYDAFTPAWAVLPQYLLGATSPRSIEVAMQRLAGKREGLSHTALSNTLGIAPQDWLSLLGIDFEPTRTQLVLPLVMRFGSSDDLLPLHPLSLLKHPWPGLGKIYWLEYNMNGRSQGLLKLGLPPQQ